MNIDQTYLVNKITQLTERVAILEKKIQYYEGNNLQNNSLQNNNLQNNNLQNNNLQNNSLQNNSQETIVNKKEEENKIYDPLSIDYIVKKNDDNNKIKHNLFNNNNNNTKKSVINMNNHDKIYDPLSN